MKKYLFMFVAMFTIAFTAFSFTSCTKEDSVYSGTSKLSIYDPDKELSEAQTAALNAMIKEVGEFNISNAESESVFMQKLNNWNLNFNNQLKAFIVAYPDVLETENAGIKLEASGLAGNKTEIHTFKEVKKLLEQAAAGLI